MKKIVLLLGVCLLAAPLSGYGFQDEISSADPELEALGAGNGRLVWSDSFTLNTEDLGETFELTVTDKLSAGTAFADGYDRISLVTAESLSTGEKLVYCSSEDGTIDYPTWNYLSESESVIPRTGVYQLTQTVFTIISGYTNVLAVFTANVTLTTEIPEGDMWSKSFGLDTVLSQPFTLYTGEEIAYGSAFEEGYDRSAEITAVGGGRTYSVYANSSDDSIGTATWNYLAESGINLGASYTLTHTVYSDGYAIGTESVSVLLSDELSPTAAWSDDFGLDTRQISPFTLYSSDKLSYGSVFADGYDRSVEVTAAGGGKTYPIFCAFEDDALGKVNWNYLAEAGIDLDASFTLTHKVYSGNTVIGTESVTVTLDSEPSADAAWSDEFSLDTANVASGGTIQLHTSDAITFSAKWAPGYERYITLMANKKSDDEEGIMAFDLTNSVEILTSDEEEEGVYAWDYSVIDPTKLPRTASYSLSYVIFSGDKVFDTQETEATITLVPEPGAALLLALMALSLMKRK